MRSSTPWVPTGRAIQLNVLFMGGRVGRGWLGARGGGGGSIVTRLCLQTTTFEQKAEVEWNPTERARLLTTATSSTTAALPNQLALLLLCCFVRLTFPHFFSLNLYEHELISCTVLMYTWVLAYLKCMCKCSISRISPSWARTGRKKTLCLLHYPRKIKFIHSFIHSFILQCCFTASTETVRTVRVGESRTSTSTFPHFLSSERLACLVRLNLFNWLSVALLPQKLLVY